MYIVCSVFVTPMDYSPQGSSLHGIFQARILERLPFPPPRESSQPSDQAHTSFVSCISRRILYRWVTWEAHMSSAMCEVDNLNFPGGPVAKALHSQCRGPGLVP